MMRPRILIAACVICPVTLARDHDVRLLRALEPGARSDYSGQATLVETVTISTGGRVLDREVRQYAIDLKGIREVLAVDDKGRATSVSFTVTYCTKTVDNRMKELAPRGSVITATFSDGEEKFTIDDATADPEATEALSLLVVLADGGPTVDEVFGTTEKQTEGSSWSISPGAAAESFATSGVRVAEKAVSGSVTLTGVGPIGGQDCLSLEGELVFAEMSLQLPDAYTLEHGELRYRFDGRFPVDTALEPLVENKEMVLTLATREKERPELEIVSVTRQTAKIRKKPL